MRLQEIFSELRRRRVFRVAGLYAVVAWAILQVADTVFSILELPNWAGKLVLALLCIGFLLAIVLAWAFDVTPEGIQRDSGLRIRRSHLLAGAVLVTLGAAAVLWNVRPGTPATGGAQAPTVAVFPFTLRGSAELEYLREGMAELLSRNLDGAAELKIADPVRVFRVWSEAPEAARSVQDAALLAQDLGAGLFVVGSITEVYNRLRVRATLYEAGDSVRVVASTGEIEADESEVFAIVDRATADLLTARFGAASRALARTASLTTDSLSALKHFLRAEQLLRTPDYGRAISGFQDAVRVDSTFALAHYRLAVAAALGNRYGAAPEAMDRALAHSARLSPREQALLHAYDAYRRGRADEAEQRYRAILRDYPDDVEARFQLADLLYRYNALRGRPIMEAQPEYLAVLAEDPDFRCPI